MQRGPPVLLAVLPPRPELQLSDAGSLVNNNNIIVLVIIIIIIILLIFILVVFRLLLASSACYPVQYRAGRLALLSPIPPRGLPHAAVKGQGRVDGRGRNVTPGEITPTFRMRSRASFSPYRRHLPCMTNTRGRAVCVTGVVRLSRTRCPGSRSLPSVSAWQRRLHVAGAAASRDGHEARQPAARSPSDKARGCRCAHGGGDMPRRPVLSYAG